MIMTAQPKKTQTQSESRKKGTIRLSSEDRARMERLFEETSSRRQEMALIVARNLGLKTSKGIQPRLNRDETEQSRGIILVVCDDQGNCGCYDYEAGTCGPC
jgi:hypothetical protein